MEVAEFEEILRVVDSSLRQIKWRLRPSSRSRLETDILALCSEMRPVIMVDYGGKMPELQERLCSFLKHCQKECSPFKLLQVMVLEDMIYLIHIKSLTEFIQSSLMMESDLLFVDLEHDPPKMIKQANESSDALQLRTVQNLFSSVFPISGLNRGNLQCSAADLPPSDKFSDDALPTSQPAEFIDLSHCLRETQITVPTLNGWLLNYPVVYLFSREHIENAIYNLSTKSLHLFQILVRRTGTTSKGSRQEELMSFSVPYDLSLEGSNEPWAKAFLARLQARWARCKNVWGSLVLEVSGCYPQAIVL